MSDHEHHEHHEHDHAPAGSGPPGTLLSLGTLTVVAACTMWLGATGRLDLYINPRYVVFTIVLAGIAVVLATAGTAAVVRSVWSARRAHGADATPGLPSGTSSAGPRTVDRTGGAASPRRARRVVGTVAGALGTVVVVGLALSMLVLPPATLSARTAVQRSVDAGSLSDATGSSGAVSLLGATTDTSAFGVKDWAAAIRTTTDASSLVGQRVDLTGFVVHRADGFTLTRFVISCCAVDAQPVGVGVVEPAGADVPADDAWVRVRGTITANPDPAASDRLVIGATTVRRVPEPGDPYEY
ncbi:TIGR03943 family putative permease subunit [Curtobacterium sp. RRHDQ10]|uniref:TIGR03943 family putative permease subunit n=1 Tax=Curtobacterium phyllosphaerae TaxID=3413379 RepID=UPI003BF058F4